MHNPFGIDKMHSINFTNGYTPALKWTQALLISYWSSIVKFIELEK